MELLTPSEGEERSTVRSGWVEHTWSTFIERAEDDDEELLLGRQRLSDFQQMKFRHFFYHVLDLNNDHVISEEDFTGLNSRVRHYMEWSINTAQYLILTEVSSVTTFLIESCSYRRYFQVHDLFIKYFLKTSAKFIKVNWLGKLW